MSTLATAWPKPSASPSPADVVAWIEAQAVELAELTSEAILQALTVGARAFRGSLDAAAFDAFPADWTAFCTEVVLPRLAFMYQAGFDSLAPVVGQGLDPFDLKFFNDRAIAHATSAAGRFAAVGAEVHAQLPGLVAQHIHDGSAPRDLAKQLRDDVGLSPTQAMTIARTEMVGAFTNGDRAGAEALSGADRPVEHVWHATNDRRTRPSHAAADQQTRPFDEPFSVGGASMMHPHAAGAPAAEVVNCRCVELFLYPGDVRPDGSTVPVDEPSAVDPAAAGPEWMDVDVWAAGRDAVDGWTPDFKADTVTVPVAGKRSTWDTVPSDALHERAAKVKAVGAQVRAEAERRSGVAHPRVVTDAEVARSTETVGKLRAAESKAYDAAQVRYRTQMGIPAEAVQSVVEQEAINADKLYLKHRRAYDKAREAHSALLDARYATVDPGDALRYRQAVVEVLHETRSFGGGAPMRAVHPNTLHPQFGSKVLADRLNGIVGDEWAVNAIEAQRQHYPTAWLDRMFDGDIVPIQTRRGYQWQVPDANVVAVSDRSAGLALDGARPGPGHTVAVHELGHLAEVTDDRLRALEWEFMQSRTTTMKAGKVVVEPQKTIYAGTQEKGFEDLFSSHYMGKTYGNALSSSSELTSMGMESLVYGTYALDAEYQDWLVGMLVTL